MAILQQNCVLKSSKTEIYIMEARNAIFPESSLVRNKQHVIRGMFYVIMSDMILVVYHIFIML